MSTVVIKILSMIWAVLFCTTFGVVVACALAAMQWAFFKIGWSLTDSGEAFSPTFWNDFFLIAACAGAFFFVISFREFWEDGITIDKK